MHTFAGKWITEKRFAAVRPVPAYRNVYDGTGGQGADSPMDVHILFRKKVTWSGTGRVVLYLSADDYAKVFVNGSPALQGPAPGYPFHTYYVRKDVTRYMHAGENTLAFHTLYQGLVNRVWVSGDLQHGLLFDLICGSETLACSDESVRVHVHEGIKPLTVSGYDTQFMERTDSRCGDGRFADERYDDGQWEHAYVRTWAEYRLFPQPGKALVFERMRPQSRCYLGEETVFDFGREFVGVPVIEAVGVHGTQIEVRCGEELNADGSVRYRMRCNCEYKEIWVLSGGKDRFEPFDYRAFRYMSVILPTNCRILSVSGIARHYPFRLKTKCAFAEPALQQVFDLCVNTLKYSLQEGYLDCPTREKAQYFGDGVWSAMSHIALTGDASLYRKMVEDFFASAQLLEGGTALGPSSLIQAIAEYPLMAVISLYGYLNLTGDRKFLIKCQGHVRSVLAAYRRLYADESGLICVYDRWNVVDWPETARDGYDFDLTQGKIIYGLHNVINAYWVLALKIYEYIYGDEPFPHARRAAQAYRETFYVEKEHRFVDSPVSTHTSLASQIFGLLTDTVNDRSAEAMAEKMILEKRLSGSNLFVTPAMFCWLKKTGRVALLTDLIADRMAWLNMLAEGATTTFECFSKENKKNASLCHTMFAFPALFLAKSVWQSDAEKGKVADGRTI